MSEETSCQNSRFAPGLRARLAGAVRQHPALSIALALKLTTAVALGAVWQTKSVTLRRPQRLPRPSRGRPRRTRWSHGQGDLIGHHHDARRRRHHPDPHRRFHHPGRPSRRRALGRPVSTDPDAVDTALDKVGADRVRAIFISHSHHDHALDVTYIANRTEATIYGSPSTLNIARGGNVPEDRLALLDRRNPSRWAASRCAPSPPNAPQPDGR